MPENCKPGQEEKTIGLTCFKKPVDLDGSAISKIAGHNTGNLRKRDGNNRKKVSPDECLYDLARREYGVGNESIIDLIQMANPRIRDVNRIYPGQVIILPHFERKDLIVKDKKGRYHIHYASSYRRSDAALYVQDLIKEGKDASMISARQGDNLVYRVYLGTFRNSDDAEKILDTLELDFFSFLPKMN